MPGMTRIAGTLGIVLLLIIAPAAAQKDDVKESFKKTEKGAGELLRGMGQELKKLGGSLTGGAKKDAKPEAKKAGEKAK
jgi:hypothetical protein